MQADKSTQQLYNEEIKNQNTIVSKPDALADVLEHSACLAMWLSTAGRIEYSRFLEVTQSACVHLKLPLQLRYRLRRLLVPLLERRLDAVRLLPVHARVIHRRQTKVLVDIFCKKRQCCMSRSHSTLLADLPTFSSRTFHDQRSKNSRVFQIKMQCFPIKW